MTDRANDPPGRLPGRFVGESGAMRRLLAGTAVTGLLAAGYAAAGDLDAHRGRLVLALALWWPTYVVLTRWVTRPRPALARPVLAVFLAALTVQLPGASVPPRSSSDAYRYVWDGRVQLAGISPYRYVPLDDRLARLRDPVIFPGLGPEDRSGVLTSPLPSERSRLFQRTHNDPRTRINRPLVPTIYPPAAQAWFVAVASVTPWSLGTTGLQLGAALVAAALAAGIAALLRRRGRSPTSAMWVAFCPSVVAEAGNGAHVDILAAGLLVLAVAVATRRPAPDSASGLPGMLPWVAAGALVGLAASVKLTPLVVLPALMPWHRIRWRAALAPLSALLTLALTYLPHVLAVGSLVLGYLPSYLREENGRNRAAVLGLVLPHDLAGPAALGLLAAVGVLVLRHRDRDPAWGATVLFGTFLLALTPTYGWYALPLIAVCVLSGRLEWLVVAGAAEVAYAGASVPGVPAVAYAVATLAVLVAVGLRRRQSHAGAAAALDPRVVALSGS